LTPFGVEALLVNKNPKKLSVVGAGALGTVVGGLIKHHRPDLDVVLVTRGEHCQRIQETGRVVLRGPWGQCSPEVSATTDLGEIANSDLVLFTVKSQHTAETARQIAPLLGDATLVALQNGVNQHALRSSIRDDRLMVGMTATNMTMTSPGEVSLQRNGLSIIGSPDGACPPALVEAARDFLATSSLPFETSDQILGIQYNKLLMNTMGYASVLSASDFIIDGILYGPWRRHVALPLLNEGFAVLEAAGIRLGRTGGMSDVIRFGRLLRALNTPGIDGIARWGVKQLVRPKKLVYSVYQDLVRGKPTEIDYINGEIVRLADQCGVPAPYNRLVVQMTHHLEKKPSDQFPTHQQVIARFRELAL
jgi:2-dehydropantoate 2-reductase